MNLLWAIVIVLSIVITILLIKLFTMKKSIDEITDEFSYWLTEDTNNPIIVSCNDKNIRHLAKEINSNLLKLREEKIRYQNGDRELKEAITNISHDLRTPLTAICGYLELLDDEECSDTIHDYIARINNRTQVMAQLTEELFNYSVISGIDEYMIKKVNLTQYLEDCMLSFYGAFVKKEITPEIDITEKEVVARLDESSLNRIFSNIISNALKYSDGDFSVKMNDKGTVVFSNTASSITTVDVGRLFDRFYTVKSCRNSTGLGLSIAKLLTEKMGGNISATYENNILSIILEFPIES